MLTMDTNNINSVARQYAEDFLNKNAILRRFEQEIEGLVAKNIC